MKGSGLPIVFVCAVAIALALFAYVLTESGSKPVGVEAAPEKTGATLTKGASALSFEPDVRHQFYSGGSGDFFCLNGDSVRYMTPAGIIKWNFVLTMAAPVIVGTGETVAVGEPGGNIVHVFGKTGELYKAEMDAVQILSFNITSGGVLSVITKSGGGYETFVYDNTGFNLWKWKYELPGIYPVAAAVSADGRVICTSVVNLEEGLNTELVFAFLDKEASKAFSDTIFYTKYEDGTIAPFIKFLQDGTLIYLTDNKIGGISLNQSGQLTGEWKNELTNRADFVGIIGGKSIALMLGDPFINKDGKTPGTLVFYDGKGGQTGEYALNRKAFMLSSGADGAIVGAGRSFYALNTKGKLLWQYDATEDVSQFQFLNNTDNALMVTNRDAIIMKKR